MKAKILMFTFLVFLMSASVFAATLTLRPNGNGAYSSWENVGCSASDEWMCVDESSPNIGDIIYTNSKNSKESFEFEDTGLTSEFISDITLYHFAQRYNGGKKNVMPLLRISGVDYTGDLWTLGNGYDYYSQTYSVNPSTGNAWTIAEVDNLQAGIASANHKGGGIVAQSYLTVNYDTLPLFPDLEIGDISFYEYEAPQNFSNPILPGEGSGTNSTVYVDVYVSVNNIGMATAGASTTRGVSLNTQYFSTPFLDAGSSVVLSETYVCSSGHNYVATADVFGDVQESDEANNDASVFIDCVI